MRKHKERSVFVPHVGEDGVVRLQNDYILGMDIAKPHTQDMTHIVLMKRVKNEHFVIEHKNFRNTLTQDELKEGIKKFLEKYQNVKIYDKPE